MERRIDDRTILDKFAEGFCKIVEKYCKYIVCSGFVAISHGRTRGTEDIDMIIERIPREIFYKLNKEILENGFESIQSDDPATLYEYLQDGSSIRYVLTGNNFAPPEMEVKFAKDILDEQQLKERQKLELTGLNIYFSSIESNIAFKEEYLKSNKDMEDARHLRIIYEGKIDEQKIEKIKRDIRRFRN